MYSTKLIGGLGNNKPMAGFNNTVGAWCPLLEDLVGAMTSVAGWNEKRD